MWEYIFTPSEEGEDKFATVEEVEPLNQGEFSETDKDESSQDSEDQDEDFYDDGSGNRNDSENTCFKSDSEVFCAIFVAGYTGLIIGISFPILLGAVCL